MTPDIPVQLWTLHQVDNSQLTTISNLLTNQTYTIRMLAYTAIGDGPLSEPTQVRTQQGGQCGNFLLKTFFTIYITYKSLMIGVLYDINPMITNSLELTSIMQYNI